MNLEKSEHGDLTPQAVRAQLHLILSSEGFVRSHRMRRFLEFVVEEQLAGRSNELGEYGIAVSVFDRGEYFEPAFDPIVRNDARRLRAKLLEYYKTAPPGSVLIEMPKGGYVPQFSRLTAPAEGRSDTSKRIAVFPFEVLSLAGDGHFHARALCISIAANLTSVDGVETIGHDFVPPRHVREAASELRLSHAILGTVVLSGERRRVVVDLVRISDGCQLWAQEFDFSSGETLAYQSEIASTVRREVVGRLGSRRPIPLQLVRAA